MHCYISLDLNLGDLYRLKASESDLHLQGLLLSKHCSLLESKTKADISIGHANGISNGHTLSNESALAHPWTIVLTVVEASETPQGIIPVTLSPAICCARGRSDGSQRTHMVPRFCLAAATSSREASVGSVRS